MSEKLTADEEAGAMGSTFSQAEMERRLALARGFMAREGLDGLVVFGMGGRQAAVCWLSEYRVLQTCYLVVPAEGDPTLLVGFLNHLPNARELSSVPAEWGGYEPAAEVAARFQASGARRLGLVGAEVSFGIGMPYPDYERLRELLPNVELVDVTAPFLRLQLVKSDEEIERMREAAALTDLALRTIVERARPGVTEYELVADAERAYRLQGGDVWITFLRSMPMDAPTGCVPAQTPSGRSLEKGDVIICELSAMSSGYLGQVLWPVFVGAEPAGEWQRLLEAGLASYRALGSAVRHGATLADAVAAAEPIRAGGYTICDSLLHGIGIGISPPHVGRALFEHPNGTDERFERGTTVVLQPNPVTTDERMGLQLGAAAIVRDDGTECLHAVPDDALIAG